MKQHYILPNADGSGIQIIQVIAQKVRFADGKEMPVRLSDGKILVGWSDEGERQKYLLDVTRGKYVFAYPTPEECVAKWHPDHPQPVNLNGKRQITPADIPADRTFRAAWKDVATKIDIDMPKARDIWRDRMRVARAPKLAALDAAYLRADEAGDALLKRTIAAQKQVLRDVTTLPAIEAAKTPEELKAVWPAELG